ncbi:uncharacterized protein STAUR_5335 [Stigmatella aurantiaca DW4/3-1]|uniref:Uncharacterized protein n=1 Tax=Stigmatella aurantiaca (strain DW4/3-1) TaxID=378806 RepID=E3FMZ1_STIAD|nr:uncharacterized protein STAUR_5335 [Stigmatella aurantiaca DW4/3-1]
MGPVWLGRCGLGPARSRASPRRGWFVGGGRGRVGQKRGACQQAREGKEFASAEMSLRQGCSRGMGEEWAMQCLRA